MYYIPLITILSAATFASGGAMILDQNTLVPMGLYVGFSLLIARLVWTAATLLRDIKNKLENGEARMADAERRLKNIEDSLR